MLPIAVLSLALTADPAPQPVDWSGFVTYGDVVGEVVKVDATGFTLRVSWLTPSSSGYRGHWHHGTSGRNPAAMAAHIRQMHSQMGRLSRSRPKEHHQDFHLTFADAGLVRWQHLPPKLGPDGKRASYTDEELKAFHTPPGARGYAADRSDLKVGHVVEVVLVRPKTVSAEKATLEDIRVKYALILGTDATLAAKAAAHADQGGSKKSNK